MHLTPATKLNGGWIKGLAVLLGTAMEGILARDCEPLEAGFLGGWGEEQYWGSNAEPRHSEAVMLYPRLCLQPREQLSSAPVFPGSHPRQTWALLVALKP